MMWFIAVVLIAFVIINIDFVVDLIMDIMKKGVPQDKIYIKALELKAIKNKLALLKKQAENIDPIVLDFINFKNEKAEKELRDYERRKYYARKNKRYYQKKW